MRQIISLAALLSLAALATAQTAADPFRETRSPGAGNQTGTKAAEKSGLEKAIEEALKTNPDLRVAIAKVNEAEAGLSRARLQVTQKVVTAYQDVEIAKATVTIAQVTLERMRKLRQSNAVAADVIDKAEQELTAAKGKLARAEADLNYLLGKPSPKVNNLATFSGFYGLNPNMPYTSTAGLAPFGLNPNTAFSGTGTISPWTYNTLNLNSALQTTAGQLAIMQALAAGNTTANTAPSGDKIRRALDHRVTIRFSETSARDALKMILKEAKGLHVQSSFKEAAWDEKLSANLTEMPLGAVLQLLEDALGNHAIVVRGYGLLVVAKNNVPPGAVLLNEFWQGGIKSEKAPKSGAQKK